ACPRRTSAMSAIHGLPTSSTTPRRTSSRCKRSSTKSRAPHLDRAGASSIGPNPTCERGMAIHDGHSMEDAASIQLAIEHWAANSQYPSGTLKVEVNGWAGYWLVRAKDDRK